MTTNEILAASRRKILEETTDLVTDETLLLYANQAYIETWKRVSTPNTIETATIVCASGVCTLPTNYGRAYGPCIDVDNNMYVELSIADYDIGNFDYGFTIKDGQLLTTNEDIVSLTLNYYPVPETLTTTQNPTIDAYFHEPIVYGVVGRAYEDLQDEELASYYLSKFENEMQRRIANQSSYEEANQRGGQMFTPQTLI